MSTFADSSALVKLYADEPGYRDVRRIPVLVISVLARVEVPSAISRKHRIGEISADVAAVLIADFEADYYGTDSEAGRFSAVQVDDSLLAGGALLSSVHGLRAHDAVQLASALAAREAEPGCTSFVAFDAQLRAAAALQGFELRPAQV
ncbi:MAG: type II toxin-antitoxin system VapC family toxin [Acidimicrobiia bacterium]|nr:type II toxin-antitoxin system VapC family toxin [Acidimicrobiia bacterium]